jgi:hypothetical protein
MIEKMMYGFGVLVIYLCLLLGRFGRLDLY